MKTNRKKERFVGLIESFNVDLDFVYRIFFPSSPSVY